MFGGVQGSKVVDFLSMYDIDAHTWTELPPAPYSLSGHTAQVYNDTMLVFFGYSPSIGYSAYVLQFDFSKFFFITLLKYIKMPI